MNEYAHAACRQGVADLGEPRGAPASPGVAGARLKHRQPTPDVGQPCLQFALIGLCERDPRFRADGTRTDQARAFEQQMDARV
nr:hypothetical protein [Pigmentiphaga sp. NML080357]